MSSKQVLANSTAMPSGSVAVTTPAEWVLAAAGTRRRAVGVALSVFFALLTAVGAQIVIPLSPVPITLQTLFVLLAGASIGRGWGSLSQALYLVLGLAGLPVLALGAGGPSVLAGPTGGYLIGFLVTPWVVGSLLRRSESVRWHAVSFAVGTLLILTLGVAHLTLFYTHDIARSLAVGVVPFLPGDAFKIAAAVSIHRSSRALVRRYAPRDRGPIAPGRSE